jgi:hypothetical protein
VPNQSHDEIIENHSQKQEHEHANTFVPNKHDIIEEHQRAKISTLPPSKPHKGISILIYVGLIILFLVLNFL